MPENPPQTIAISEFKATCLAVLERVRRTGTPIVVTRRGKPVAEVVPPSLASTGGAWLGSMHDTATIEGDLVAPASHGDDWEALALVERGRLTVKGSAADWVEALVQALPRREAPLTHEIAVASRLLTLSHPDPANRFIAATAKVMELTLVTADERLLGTTEYAVLANR